MESSCFEHCENTGVPSARLALKPLVTVALHRFLGIALAPIGDFEFTFRPVKAEKGHPRLPATPLFEIDAKGQIGDPGQKRRIPASQIRIELHRSPRGNCEKR